MSDVTKRHGEEYARAREGVKGEGASEAMLERDQAVEVEKKAYRQYLDYIRSKKEKKDKKVASLEKKGVLVSHGGAIRSAAASAGTAAKRAAQEGTSVPGPTLSSQVKRLQASGEEHDDVAGGAAEDIDLEEQDVQFVERSPASGRSTSSTSTLGKATTLLSSMADSITALVFYILHFNLNIITTKLLTSMPVRR